MTRSGSHSSTNYAGLRAALVLGSVAASVLGGRLATARDAAAQAAAQSQEPDQAEEQALATVGPQPTPTPRIIYVYDLPPVAAAPDGSQPVNPGAQVNPALPPPPVVDAGGGGGGGGGKPKPAKKGKSS